MSSKNYLKRNRSVSGRYSELKRSAKKRNLAMTITKEEYEIIVYADCDYCGADLSSVAGHALDRINSSVGYTLENVVPCCETCNIMKSSLSLEEFRAHIKRVCEKLKL